MPAATSTAPTAALGRPYQRSHRALGRVLASLSKTASQTLFGHCGGAKTCGHRHAMPREKAAHDTKKWPESGMQRLHWGIRSPSGVDTVIQPHASLRSLTPPGRHRHGAGVDFAVGPPRDALKPCRTCVMYIDASVTRAPECTTTAPHRRPKGCFLCHVWQEPAPPEPLPLSTRRKLHETNKGRAPLRCRLRVQYSGR